MSSLPTLVIAGASSGVGKTTLSAALAYALRRRGLGVQTFKCGPDYLDPSYHCAATGRACHNLDPWMMGEAAVHRTFALATRDADVALVEGMMGLFDGRDAASNDGSTAHLAKLLGAPVLLVFDAAGMARSAAALVQGFRAFDPELSLVACLANRVGGPQHGALLARAMPEGLAFFALTHAPSLAFPERHLGLVTADQESETRIARWAEQLEGEIDVSALLEIMRHHAPKRADPPALGVATRTRCRIGIARDAAFHFYYPYNLDALARAGAELVDFSPLHDASLPDVHALYIGGGYPEVHADVLARNSAMTSAVRAFAAAGRPVYAECGGLMYLCEAIRTGAPEEARYPMVGLLPGEARMHPTLRALGYRQVCTTRDTFFGPQGTQLHGHEFRYSELSSADRPGGAYQMQGFGGMRSEGYGADNVLASYVHLHWGRTPEVAAHFVAAACKAAS